MTWREQVDLLVHELVHRARLDAIYEDDKTAMAWAVALRDLNNKLDEKEPRS